MIDKDPITEVGVRSELPEGDQHIPQATVEALLANASTTLFLSKDIKRVDTSSVNFRRAVIRESSPGTRFLLTEDVSFLDPKLPGQTHAARAFLASTEAQT